MSDLSIADAYRQRDLALLASKRDETCRAMRHASPSQVEQLNKELANNDSETARISALTGAELIAAYKSKAVIRTYEYSEPVMFGFAEPGVDKGI